ncbi:MAG: F0F1 ATP synthase subunit B [Blastocatellia bacterium]
MILDQFIRPALFLAAEQAEAGGLFSNPDLWRVINLLVFVLIFVYILRNKIRIGQVFDNRAASIVKELEQAKRDKQDAQQRLRELETRLARLDQELEQIRTEAERESAREAERVRMEAEADAEKVRQTAQREIEGAMKAARSELRAFVADQSVALAEGIIRREIRPEDNSRMMNRFIDDLHEVSK